MPLLPALIEEHQFPELMPSKFKFILTFSLTILACSYFVMDASRP